MTGKFEFKKRQRTNKDTWARCIWQAATVPEIENITAKFSGLLVCPLAARNQQLRVIKPSSFDVRLFHAVQTFGFGARK
jgi:hypothetical protein